MSVGLDLRATWLAELDRAAAAAGHAIRSDVPEGMSFRQWCEKLAAMDDGLKVDQKPWDLTDRPALIPIYDALPKNREDARNRILVIQKSTQIGLTVWSTLAQVWMAKAWAPLNIASFVPDQASASFLSSHRWLPIIRSIPSIFRELVVPHNIMTRCRGIRRSSGYGAGCDR